MKKKVAIPLVVMVSAVALASCGSETLKAPTLLSKEKQEAVVSKISDMTIENKAPSQIEKEVKSNVARMTKENASKAVYFLDYSIDSRQGDAIEDLTVFGEKLKNADTEKVDYNKPNTYKYIGDSSVKGFLEELDKQYLMIREKDGNYFVVKNEGEVLSKYKDYLNQPVMELLMAQKKLANSPSGKKGLEGKLEILLGGESNKESWKGTPYEKNWLAFLGFVYQDFFTPVQGDALTEKEKEEYYRLQTEYSNSVVGSDIAEFMGLIEKADGKVSEDVIEFVQKNVEKHYPITNTTPEGLVQ